MQPNFPLFSPSSPTTVIINDELARNYDFLMSERDRLEANLELRDASYEENYPVLRQADYAAYSVIVVVFITLFMAGFLLHQAFGLSLVIVVIVTTAMACGGYFLWSRTLSLKWARALRRNDEDRYRNTNDELISWYGELRQIVHESGVGTLARDADGVYATVHLRGGSRRDLARARNATDGVHDSFTTFYLIDENLMVSRAVITSDNQGNTILTTNVR